MTMPLSLDDFTVHARAAIKKVQEAMPQGMGFVLVVAMKGAPAIIGSNLDREQAKMLLEFGNESFTVDAERLDQ